MSLRIRIVFRPYWRCCRGCYRVEKKTHEKISKHRVTSEVLDVFTGCVEDSPVKSRHLNNGSEVGVQMMKMSSSNHVDKPPEIPLDDEGRKISTMITSHQKLRNHSNNHNFTMIMYIKHPKQISTWHSHKNTYPNQGENYYFDSHNLLFTFRYVFVCSQSRRKKVHEVFCWDFSSR